MVNIDATVFFFFNRTLHCAVLNIVMPYITQLGNSSFIFVVGFLMLLFRKRHVRAAGIVLLAGLTLSYYAAGALKHIVMRPRPFLTLEGANALVIADGFSFPSGHATVAFLTALVMTRYFRRWYIFYTLAVLVVFSRMYLGVHYPVDVTAGACLGTFIGYFLVKIEESIGRQS